jgi:phage terminase small subunit
MDQTALDEALDQLSMKQRLFVEAYFASEYNGSEAVRKAGYSTKYPNRMAYELLKKPHIKKAVDLLAAKKVEEVTVSQEYVLRKLVKTVEKAETVDNYTALLRGLEMLAKHLGMFVERTEISGKDGEAIKIQEVENEAADFARAIARIADRSGEAGGTTETSH